MLLPRRRRDLPIEGQSILRNKRFQRATRDLARNAIDGAQQALAIYSDNVLAGLGVEIRVAMMKLLLGDNEGALTSLEKAVQSKAVNLRPHLRFAPVWDPLRNDPRFQKLCEEKKQ